MPAKRSTGLLLVFVFLVTALRGSPQPRPPQLANAYRQDHNGWIFVSLHGSPHQIGFQHGYLLAREINETLRMLVFYMERSTKRNWSFFRENAVRMFWLKLEDQYRQEITGIVDGLRTRLPGSTWDPVDLTVLNGWIELASYYVPYLDEKKQPGTGTNKAPGKCSAFIATGSWTRDKKIVIGHNNWSEYLVGQRWNVILDIKPQQGFRMMMDAMPGYIHSGDDFMINSAGLVYTETTISGFRGFNENGTPEFMRARQAAQYAATINDFARIMTTDNNGGYANDWLIGDTKTNEIAKLELGLKNQLLWRTRDGCFIGANFPSDGKFIAEETTFDAGDESQSVLVRKKRWEKLMAEFKGEIDVETGKLFETDHLDDATGLPGANSNTLCGHNDLDPRGLPEFSWKPFWPGGAVQAKVTSTALVRQMKFWARMGHPCGREFLAEPFLAAHPEFRWQTPFLRDMKANSWTLFPGKK